MAGQQTSQNLMNCPLCMTVFPRESLEAHGDVCPEMMVEIYPSVLRTDSKCTVHTAGTIYFGLKGKAPLPLGWACRLFFGNAPFRFFFLGGNVAFTFRYALCSFVAAGFWL